MSQPQLYFLRGTDGKTLPVGKRQAEFLLDAGHVRRATQHPFVYDAAEHTAEELHAIVLAERSLRECDFCTATPAGWKVECSVFEQDVGDGIKGPMGGPKRPVFVCSECVIYIRNRDGRGLVEHAVREVFESAKERGIVPPGVSKRRAMDAIRPRVAITVNNVFTHMHSEPEED